MTLSERLGLGVLAATSGERVVWRPPNVMRISCRPSSPDPHNLSFHSAFKEGTARAEACG